MGVLQWALILFAPTAFAGYALKKKSVDKSGAIAGWVVGFGCVLAGWHFFWSLLFFFVTSTLLTKMGSKRKKKIEDGYKEGGQRNWVQVFSNAFSGTLACFAIAYLDAFGAPTGYDADTLKFALTAGFLGHFGCCIGDTWASGGLTLGACFALTAPASQFSMYHALVIGMLSGLGGSLLDSILGATVQFSGYSESKQRVVNEPGPDVKRISGRHILDNHQVNFVSSTSAALIAAAASLFVL